MDLPAPPATRPIYHLLRAHEAHLELGEGSSPEQAARLREAAALGQGAEAAAPAQKRKPRGKVKK